MSAGKKFVAACVVVVVAALCANAFAAKDRPAGATTAPTHQKITAVQAAVLGVVEGLTEYLPVSSTGHLIIAGHFMNMTHFRPPEAKRGIFGDRLLDKDQMTALDSFEIVIQFGAILAVLGLYRRRVGQMIGGLGARAGAFFRRGNTGGQWIIPVEHQGGLKVVGLLLLAFLPAAIVGKLFHNKIEEYLFGPIPVTIALAIGGMLMIVVEYYFWIRKRDVQRTTSVDAMLWRQALIIGLAQVLAMWPGTSRSMITIIAGLVVGLDMVAAAEFSFLLALPTLGAATLYSACKNWPELQAGVGLDGLLIGTIVSGIVAALAVKWFVSWLTRHGMIPFGIYRITLAAVLLLLVA